MTTTMRPWRGWLALLPLLWLLDGCGPGVGGTGTGEQSFGLGYFGAKPSSVCTTSFAGQLKCASRIVIGPARADPPAGSELVVWADDALAPTVIARIDLSDVEFEAVCENLRFTGTWGRGSDGGERFFGSYRGAGSELDAPGTLSVEGADGATMTYVLRDAAENVIFGSPPLQSADDDVRSSQCPGSFTSPRPRAGSTR